MEKHPENKMEGVELRQKIMTIVGIVLCVILVPILLINCIMIIQSMVNKDEVPGIGGLSPMIVLTESMDDTIKAGDIIITKAIDGEDVEKGDVICFFDPVGNGTSTTTHRVIEIEDREGTLYFQTQGDNNNTPDRVWVSENNLVGEWTGVRIPLLGHVALFMQTTGGLIVCVLLPLGLLIGYEFFRRKKADESKQNDVEALMKELEALKAAQTAGTGHCEQSEAIPQTESNSHCDQPQLFGEAKEQSDEAIPQD